MRAFIAIAIPAEIRGVIAKQAALLSRQTRDIRWVPSENLHVTLAFLGEVPSQNADSIESGMEAAARKHGAFSIGFGGGGTFPRGGEPHLGVIDITGDLAAVRALQADITKEMRQLRMRVDDRPFSPHVTLARIGRQATPSARNAIAHRFGEFDLATQGVFTVDAIALMESDLVRTGAVYRQVLSVELGLDASRRTQGRRFGFLRGG